MKTFQQLQERLTQQQKDDALYWRYKQLQDPKSKDPIDYKKEKLNLPLAQVTPIPVISPFKGMTYIDPSSKEERLKRQQLGIKGQVDFYDSPWGKLQGGPPKGP